MVRIHRGSPKTFLVFGIVTQVSFILLKYSSLSLYSETLLNLLSLSSSGLGHCPFTAETGVRLPLGTPVIFPEEKCLAGQPFAKVSYVLRLLSQIIIIPR